jgi:hypothetical protein
MPATVLEILQEDGVYPNLYRVADSLTPRMVRVEGHNVPIMTQKLEASPNGKASPR